MNHETFARLEPLLTSMVSSAAEQLRQECHQEGFFPRIVFGNWSNDAGIMLGYISCYPTDDLGENSLDMTWQFTTDQNVVMIEGNICQSNGEIVSTILDRSVSLADPKVAVRELEISLEAGFADAIDQLKRILCRQWRKEDSHK